MQHQDNSKYSHLSFSERYKFRKIDSAIQIDSIKPELKNSLWNVFRFNVFEKYIQTVSSVSILYGESPSAPEYNKKDIYKFIIFLWDSYFKYPVDELLENLFRPQKIVHEIKDHFFNKFEWYDVYDFLEISINYFECEDLIKSINKILSVEMSAYRFVGGIFTPITSEQEIQMLEEALSDDQFQSVSNHLSQALQLMSDKQKPDYRNSIKESISAVESLARIITDNPKATLGQALGKIESSGKLHPTLKASFSALYGYTSDEHGIRHSMSEEPNLTIDDAKFFLLSCTSFINYLKAKM